ncbi:MAG: ABC transporter permease [Leptolyngbyaceae cyanobacterium SM1_3_5]|nr:ABC transporter permease [Leptolyngbyaceae cyanobacterium SM1_3_5]
MSYLLKNLDVVWELVLEHLQMTSLTLAIAILFALPIALLVTRYRVLNVPILGVLGILYTVPSLALIILLVPLFGLNQRSVIAAMVIYTQVILVRNLVVGLDGIKPAIIEAAKGMGMNAWQRWWQIQVPLITPVFLAGLRLAAIVAVAIATIGAKFGAGGLGQLLFDGVSQNRYDKIWAGGIAVAVLAFVINGALLLLEWAANPTRKMKRSMRVGRSLQANRSAV